VEPVVEVVVEVAVEALGLRRACLLAESVASRRALANVSASALS